MLHDACSHPCPTHTPTRPQILVTEMRICRFTESSDYTVRLISYYLTYSSDISNILHTYCCSVLSSVWLVSLTFLPLLPVTWRVRAGVRVGVQEAVQVRVQRERQEVEVEVEVEVRQPHRQSAGA